MNSLISVILPCRNEEKTIGECIAKIRKVFSDRKIQGEIIVSDSSQDDSARIAKKMGVNVVRHNKDGYGYAYHEGFKHARGDIIIIGDADGTYDFEEIPKLLRKAYGNDIVIGSRIKGKIMKGAMPWHHRYIGNPALSFLLRILFRSKIKDTQSGFRLIKRQAWEKLNLQTKGMEFASEMIIRATKQGMNIKEVPITYYPRHNNSRSKLNSFQDGWKHLRFMLLYSPAILFIIPGLVLLFLGISAMIFINASPSSYISILFIILGYHVMLLGLFAKTYAAVHLKHKSKIIDIINNILSLEKGIFFGLFFIIASIIIFPFLESPVPSITVLIIGLQTLFSAFFLSIIGIEER